MLAWIQTNRIWISRGIVALSVPIVLVTHPRGGAGVHLSLNAAGAVLVAVGVLGRIWATLYIAGRKNIQLVTHGPYSICRNPLYLFSALILLGVLCLFQNALLVLPITVLFCLTYAVTIREEESLLRSLFGASYTDYARRVPRLLPALWKYDCAPLGAPMSMSPGRVMQGVLDTGWALLFVPLSDVVEYLHVTGTLPVWLPSELSVISVGRKTFSRQIPNDNKAKNPIRPIRCEGQPTKRKANEHASRPTITARI